MKEWMKRAWRKLDKFIDWLFIEEDPALREGNEDGEDTGSGFAKFVSKAKGFFRNLRGKKLEK